MQHLLWVLTGSLNYTLPKQQHESFRVLDENWKRQETRSYSTDKNRATLSIIFHGDVSSRRWHTAAGSWVPLLTVQSWTLYAHEAPPHHLQEDNNCDCLQTFLESSEKVTLVSNDDKWDNSPQILSTAKRRNVLYLFKLQNSKIYNTVQAFHVFWWFLWEKTVVFLSVAIWWASNNHSRTVQ